MKEVLITLDPGQTTGYTKWEQVNGSWKFVESGIFPTWVDLDEILRKAGWCTVVYEVVRGKHPSFNPIGIEVMGVIKYLIEKAQLPNKPQFPHSLVGPSKWPAVRDCIKKLKTQHEKDAFLHAIVYFSSRADLYELPKI